MELRWDPLADEQMTRLELAGPSPALAAVNRTLARLELDPFDPKLRTRQFVSQHYEHVRPVPTGHNDWMVLWTLGDTDDWILIIAVAPLEL